MLIHRGEGELLGHAIATDRLHHDAELADPGITGNWNVDFDPMDVPRDRFPVAGQAPFEGVRRLFAEDDTLRTPDTVTCAAPFNGESRVTLRR